MAGNSMDGRKLAPIDAQAINLFTQLLTSFHRVSRPAIPRLLILYQMGSTFKVFLWLLEGENESISLLKF